MLSIFRIKCAAQTVLQNWYQGQNFIPITTKTFCNAVSGRVALSLCSKLLLSTVLNPQNVVSCKIKTNQGGMLYLSCNLTGSKPWSIPKFKFINCYIQKLSKEFKKWFTDINLIRILIYGIEFADTARRQLSFFISNVNSLLFLYSGWWH